MKNTKYNIIQSVKFLGVIDPIFVAQSNNLCESKVEVAIKELTASNVLKLSHIRGGKKYYKFT